MLLITGKEGCVWIEHRFFVLWIDDGSFSGRVGETGQRSAARWAEKLSDISTKMNVNS